jgi:hypothetical protein
MAAAAPARKASPTRKRAVGRTPRSALREERKRSPRTGGRARHVARATPARSKSRRAGRARRAVRATPGPSRQSSAHLIPLAIGRTAVAVRGLPDSGLVVRLTRGRAWIVALSVLLTGIVALNVVNLSLSASHGRISQQIQAIEQENSVLRARLAQRLSNDRVRSAAAYLGMTAPEPRDISYRNASGRDIRLAARRLGTGFGAGTSLVVTPATTVPPAAPASSTAAPTATTPPETTASAPVPTTTTSATTASAGTPGGGVSPG